MCQVEKKQHKTKHFFRTPCSPATKKQLSVEMLLVEGCFFTFPDTFRPLNWRTWSHGVKWPRGAGFGRTSDSLSSSALALLGRNMVGHGYVWNTLSPSSSAVWEWLNSLCESTSDGKKNRTDETGEVMWFYFGAALTWFCPLCAIRWLAISWVFMSPMKNTLRLLMCSDIY